MHTARLRLYHSANGMRGHRLGAAGVARFARHCPTPPGGVPLCQQVGHGMGTADEQREPRHIARIKRVIFWRDQLAPDDPIARPKRVDQVTVPVDPQQLECGIRHPMRGSLPLADRPQGNAEEFGGVQTGHSGSAASVPELVSGDPEQARATAQAHPVGGLAYFA